MVPTKSKIIVRDRIPMWKPEFDSRIGHHVKKSKRGACEQKAATVLPNRTAATLCICSSLSFFEFDIVRYGGT